MTATALVVTLVIGLPALAFALWPLLGRRGDGAGAFLALPVEPREELEEDKRAALRAIRELEFEHGAGHVSDEDYASLRARYEQEAASALTALDRLGPSTPRERPAPPAAAAQGPGPARGWRHPLALGGAGVMLLVFGVALGVGIVRYTEPDRMNGMPSGVPAMPPLAATPPGGPLPGGTVAGPLAPGVVQGMLQAARAALLEGQYAQALAAYQAVLTRDPQNVDAITHLGLILAIGGGAEHADRALETFDRALALDPSYPPALLYRGQVLYDVKKDVPGALRTWEKFLAVAPAGEDRDRVAKLVREARTPR